MINGPDYLRIFERFLNLAENDSGSPETDYKTIYRYGDGNGKRRQVTLGRGFTQDGGNLWKVLARYIAKGGARAEFFGPYETKMRDGALWQDTAFLKALGAASVEEAMRDAQDEVFKEVYLTPALEWADSRGFKLPLSYAVAVDSYLHSGQMTKWLVASFPEPTPANGGDEKVWMKAYLEARLAWFTRVSGDLHTCMFRPQFFLGEIAANNWELHCPLTVRGKGRIC